MKYTIKWYIINAVHIIKYIISVRVLKASYNHIHQIDNRLLYILSLVLFARRDIPSSFTFYEVD